ncbi:MAG: 2-succinyl-5-enolpyruvyl-6-hydroxy-3-cyclohexene-1-carboxylate synthase, partial [Bacteroidetes bacterium]|nr:2-succinyl-5-enolpyruvyl-6-hydroxy-3-cyclohexene-1-carboxylate synthase [Bacteroidota bacterium]
MQYPKNLLAQTLIQLCKAKEIKHVIISPGSRNAPLTIGFTNDSFFKCFSIVDERCAAFFALGIVQQLKEPVALVCTSGSALLNYYPAVAEAFYSDLSLVVLSADRPEHLIGIGDGQTINQKNVFKNHILYSANLIEDNQEQNEIEINAAINFAIVNKGPVHINVPFNEPLYELVEELSVKPKVEVSKTIHSNIISEVLDELVHIWNSSKRKMVLIGVNHPNQIEQKWLDAFAKDDSVIVFT